MSPHSPEAIAALNEQSLKVLVRAIAQAENRFSLILVRCNYTSLRRQLIQQLRQRSPMAIEELALPESTASLFTAISDQQLANQQQPTTNNQQPAALMIVGIETVAAIDDFLVASNMARELLQNHFPLPMVLWGSDRILQKLTRLAPDLTSWAGNDILEFEIAPTDLIQSLKAHTRDLFASILDIGDEWILSGWAISRRNTALRGVELEFALNDLHSYGHPMEPDLQADLDFLLGRDALAQAELHVARECFQRSLEFWESQGRREERGVRGEESGARREESGVTIIGSTNEVGVNNGERSQEPGGKGDKGAREIEASSSPSSLPHSSLPHFLLLPSAQERAACILIHLGLCWRAEAVLQRVEYAFACRQARELFRQGLEGFEQAHRQDLVARFIIALAEVLYKLKDWDALEPLAQQALVLHKLHGDPVRQARDHGYLAEVALARQHWLGAKRQVEAALRILTTVEDSAAAHDHSLPVLEISLEVAHRFHRGNYLLLLAKAEEGLGNLAAAIAHLEDARNHSYPKDDPILYIQILEKLQAYYWQQKEYLQAFYIKQNQRSLEQQFGFRAFVGALRLQPNQQFTGTQLASPTLFNSDELLAQEIAASGRQQDVDRLIARLSSTEIKLTVIHGPSGVGKSSILTAGLMPALRKKFSIAGRFILPILLDRYTNWQTTLSDRLETAIRNHPYLRKSAKGAKQAEDVQGQEQAQGTAPTSSPSSLSSPSSPPLIPLLRSTIDRNAFIVLIFDQFEEFFFEHDTLPKRRAFYDFLYDCLKGIKLPHVQVILSLREDYLHYLLEFQRCTNLDFTRDILGEAMRYPLGDFSPADARTVIKKLTDQARFYLDADLIDALVQDLSGELGAVRPIELQVVGAQLQAENITTLAQYRALDPPQPPFIRGEPEFGSPPYKGGFRGIPDQTPTADPPQPPRSAPLPLEPRGGQEGAKEILVQRSLTAVVKDCGPENEAVARIVLFLLTNANGTRPQKTQEDLETDLVDLGLTGEIPKLDLVLEVLVGSGLVFLFLDTPANYYQLVHDYLVSFIRNQQESDVARLQAALEREREQRERAELQQKETQIELELSQKSKKTLEHAYRKAQNLVKGGLLIFVVTIVLSIGTLSYFTGLANEQSRKSKLLEGKAKILVEQLELLQKNLLENLKNLANTRGVTIALISQIKFLLKELEKPANQFPESRKLKKDLEEIHTLLVGTCQALGKTSRVLAPALIIRDAPAGKDTGGTVYQGDQLVVTGKRVYRAGRYWLEIQSGRWVAESYLAPQSIHEELLKNEPLIQENLAKRCEE